MRLYLLQHGSALPKEVDADRPLDERGRADVIALAEWLRGRGVRVGRILHSGKARARQTAELLSGLSEGPVRKHPGLAPNDSTDALRSLVDGSDEDLLTVSHMPFLGRAVAELVGADPGRPIVDFVPRSLARLERDPHGLWRIALFRQPHDLARRSAIEGAR